MRATVGMRFYPAIDPGSLRKCPKCGEWLYAHRDFDLFTDGRDRWSDIWCKWCARAKAQVRA